MTWRARACAAHGAALSQPLALPFPLSIPPCWSPGAGPCLATRTKVRTHWDAHAVQHLLLERVAALRAAATLDQNVRGLAAGWHGAPSESAS